MHAVEEYLPRRYSIDGDSLVVRSTRPNRRIDDWGLQRWRVRVRMSAVSDLDLGYKTRMTENTTTQPLMSKKIKIHDGIVGAIVALSALMAWQFDPRWIGLAGLTAAIMISSSFTGFCPVHFLVSKIVRN